EPSLPPSRGPRGRDLLRAGLRPAGAVRPVLTPPGSHGPARRRRCLGLVLDSAVVRGPAVGLAAARGPSRTAADRARYGRASSVGRGDLGEVTRVVGGARRAPLVRADPGIRAVHVDPSVSLPAARGRARGDRCGSTPTTRSRGAGLVRASTGLGRSRVRADGGRAPLRNRRDTSRPRPLVLVRWRVTHSSPSRDPN